MTTTPEQLSNELVELFRTTYEQEHGTRISREKGRIMAYEALIYVRSILILARRSDATNKTRDSTIV